MSAATTCGTDSCCDQAIAKALQCAQDAGSNTAVMNCFTSNYMAGGANATALVTCLVMHQSGDAACPSAVPTGEGGAEEGGEGGTATEGGGGEGGGDAGASDAASGG